MNQFRMSAPCLFGLESVVAFEAKRAGGQDVAVSDGRVTFSGDWNTLARANLTFSAAERVQILLGEFPASTFDQLFEGVKALPLEAFIGPKDAFPVKGHSLNSQLHSVPACQSIIKKAAVTRLQGKYGLNYFEESGPVMQLQFNILKDHVTLCLDTSGQSLHKRGYRRDSNAAPIRETLAAGIIDLARIRPESVVCDPFCGSGTFLAEAAYKALNIAPGLYNRTFAAEEWNCSPANIWQAERQRAMEAVRRETAFHAYGWDYDADAVQLSLENCRKARIESCVTVKQADIKDYVCQPGTVTICNPPYGERLLDIRQAEELYRIMGSVFPADKEHPCYIISPHEDFEKFFGRKADKRRKLYNGMIKCQLFMYFR